MNFKEEMVKRLKSDCEYLVKTKLPKALENICDDKGVNTYRNLTKALADNVKLIDEYDNDYKAMWSIYKAGVNQDSLTPQVAVWMQNSNGDIDSYHVFNIACDFDDKIINGVNTVTFRDGKSQFYKEWEERFIREHSFGMPRTVFKVTDNVRNIGKTTFLKSQAKFNNGIYVSQSKSQGGISKIDDLRGYNRNTKVYVDEGVSDEIVEYVENNFREYFIFKIIK